MAKESVSERLARLKAQAAYDLAPELRYRVAEEPGEKPGPSKTIAEPSKVEALRLSNPDLAQEYNWISNCRERGVVPAIKVYTRNKYEVYVYPKKDLRYTLAAWAEFRSQHVKVDGLVAVGTQTDCEGAEELLRFMVDVANRDAAPERLERALTTSPQDWLHELKGCGGEWLSISSDNLTEDLNKSGWSVRECYDMVDQRDLEVYSVYLAEKGLVKVVPRTSVSERLTRYQSRSEEQYRDFRQRNRARFSLKCPVLASHLLGPKWTGWDDFHSEFPSAPGVLSLSAVGYSKDTQTAFFTAFNRCDPRLLDSSNADAGTLEYLERVWLERNPDGWFVKEKVTYHARPIDAGPLGALSSVGSVRPTVTRASNLLEGLSVEVECEGADEMFIGFQDGRPTAFFTIEGLHGGHAIVAVIGGSARRTFEPSEIHTHRRLSFHLDNRDLVFIEEESTMKEWLGTDSVVVSVFVWIDGDWRTGNAALEPGELQSELCNYSFVVHDPHVLDLLYLNCRGR
ncbi:MAG: hypothetical protein KC800_17430 [Candidatus Eremiobacteraeota bacterium]|nr:hypothetical protein [Candidatus Eremiobacteraeota bacterium]